MSMTVSDIGQALLDLDADGSQTATNPLVSAHGHAWSVLTIAAGETWSSEGAPGLPLSMLILEGHGTYAAPSGRQSIGSGHLVIIERGAAHTLTNETKAPIRAAITWTDAQAPGEDE
ncbi:MAG: hypothetical protein ACPGU1_20940 [Myxococcota bacterium]